MQTSGSVAPADMASRTSHLDVACSRCDRRGRYHLPQLVDQSGADFLMTDLGAELANCPNRRSSAHGERCDVFFPGLAALPRAQSRRKRPQRLAPRRCNDRWLSTYS